MNTNPPPSPVEPGLSLALIGPGEEPLGEEIERIAEQVWRDIAGMQPPPLSPRRFPSINALLDHVTRQGEYPDLVLLAESWPGEYPAGEVDALYEQLPLARLVVVLGPWLESVGRTGAIWPPALRVRQRELAFRLHHEFRVLRQGRSEAPEPRPTPPLPLTATRDETFSFDVAEFAVGDMADMASSPPLPEFEARVVTSDESLGRWLDDCVKACGGVPHSPFPPLSESGVEQELDSRSHPRLTIGLLDGDCSSASEFEARWKEVCQPGLIGLIIVTSHWETSPSRFPAVPFPVHVVSKFAPLHHLRHLIATAVGAGNVSDGPPSEPET